MTETQAGKPRQPIAGEYRFKSAPFIGRHATQIAIDIDGEYAVNTSSDPTKVAQRLRAIADHIIQDQKGAL